MPAPPSSPPTTEPPGGRPVGPHGRDGGAAGPAASARRVPVLPGLVVAAVGVAGVWAVWRGFVLSRTGRTVDVGALDGAEFGRNRLWTAAEQVLDVVSVPLLAAVLLATVLLAVVRRRVVLAVQVALVMGGANLTTQVLKRWVLDRPDVGIEADHLLPSLPSGHTTAAASVATAFLLVVPRRVRPVAAVVGAAYTLATGVSTLVAGWHRPSDVVAAVLVVLAWAGVASAVGAVMDPTGRELGEPHGDRPRPTATAVALLLVATGATGAAAAVALERTVSALDDGLQPGRELVTAYAGGALGITAVSCACFAILLLVRRATEAGARRAERARGA